ncbi:MAG TPA: hypothetical protein PKJ37_02560 [Acidobacteriota bacterium]|nr:hypothetical protein [Acidobacteriota bacterium]HNT16764.1 hypothetical protein [Acidobacteriota bacterium]
MKKALILAVAVSLVLMFGCKSKESAELAAQMKQVQKIAKLEKQITEKQEKMNMLIRQYAQEGGKDLGLVLDQSMGTDQRELLEKKLQNEEGIGYKDLISDILKQQKEIEDLKVQVQDLEKKLPAPTLVKRGDKHFDIGMQYLTKEKGLDEAAAKKLIYQTNIMDELVPGFKVWNFYDNGVYGTFVTQGDAAVSPYGVIQAAKKKLVDEKNTAVSQKEVLQKEKTTLLEQVDDLQKRRDQLNQDVMLLQQEREELVRKLAEVRELSEELKSKLNSVFFRAGERKALVDSGLVKDPVFGSAKILKFQDENFPDRIDLRSQDAISISAEQCGVPSIKKVRVVPTSFKEGVDFTVVILGGGATANINILSKDKFRAERTVVVLVN